MSVGNITVKLFNSFIISKFIITLNANVFFVAVLITSILLNVLKSEVPIKSGLSTVDPAGNDPATP